MNKYLLYTLIFIGVLSADLLGIIIVIIIKKRKEKKKDNEIQDM